jgi:uncharacterized protein YjbI with pentapeptide repeats
MRPRASKQFVFSRREPEIPEELQTGADMDDVPDILVAEQRITGADWRGRKADTLRVESSVLEHVNLAGCRFNSIVLKDVRFVGCELANLNVRGLTLVRTEFIDCRMTGLTGGEVDGQDVLIREGDQRYCQMRSSRFKAAEFDACNFEDADFQETDFTGAVFRRCNLRNVEMGKAKLYDADLRGSMVEGLHVAPEALRGAVVDAAQAMVFAQLLGIRIE